MNTYLEISGRGTGKTYRLIKAINELAKREGVEKIHIVTLTSREFKMICNKLTEQALCKIVRIKNSDEFRGLNIKFLFLEEFDYIRWLTPSLLIPLGENAYIYAVGTPKKPIDVRSILDYNQTVTRYLLCRNKLGFKSHSRKIDEAILFSGRTEQEIMMDEQRKKEFFNNLSK